MKGTLTSLSPLTVRVGSQTAACSVPSGFSLAGFAVGDFVEMTCDLRAGAWVLRALHHEDEDEIGRDDEEDVDNPGPGNGEDDDEDEDTSGPGNGDDDDDDDRGGNSGPGGGDDDDD